MKGDAEILFIQQAIDMTILYLEKYSEGFNPNNYHSYIGLDESASNIFKEVIKKLYKEETEIIHGYIAPHWRVKSSEWSKEHTWCKYKDYYVDITISQFLPIIKNVPSFYISKKKPKWFTTKQKNQSKLITSVYDRIHQTFYKEK